MDIINKIDKLRTAKGWTFYKLSEQTGLSQQTFTKWMQGNTIPTIPALKSVCDAFGITLANFFAENDMIEVTPETKVIFDNWIYLSKEEQSSIKTIIDNYINKRK
ncbi:MAG: helix-turn-helix transcriptional regulator [Clostridia bacterium]|nr:helix-turn-helix transcriptional regulator [Clostridia bacterium]